MRRALSSVCVYVSCCEITFFWGEKKTKRPFFLRSKRLSIFLEQKKKQKKKNVPNNTVTKVTHNTKKNELSKKVGVLENQYCDDDDDDVEARFLDPRRGSPAAPSLPQVDEETTQQRATREKERRTVCCTTTGRRNLNELFH